MALCMWYFTNFADFRRVNYCYLFGGGEKERERKREREREREREGESVGVGEGRSIRGCFGAGFFLGMGFFRWVFGF